MSELRDEIDATDVPEDSVALWWLGQAGYAIKTAGGTVALIDAYLSDIVEQLYGQPRILPKLLDPATARPDIIFATHWHEDHYDAGAIRPLTTGNDAIVVGPSSVVARVTGVGVPPERVVVLDRGETIQVRDISVTGTFARHEVAGFLAEDALGMLLDSGGPRLYHSGDTEYDARLRPVAQLQPQVAMLCMNGSGGCMNAHEAALLAWQLGAQVLYPNHFNMWAAAKYGPGATLDPARFEQTYHALGGTGRVRVPGVGALELLHAAGDGVSVGSYGNPSACCRPISRRCAASAAMFGSTC